MGRKRYARWVFLLTVGLAPILLADDSPTITNDVTASQPSSDAIPSLIEPADEDGLASEEAQAAHAEGLKNEFALSAYLALSAEHPDENLVFSPADLARVLSLVHAGANGPTRDEIAVALGFTPSAELWSAIDAALEEAVHRPRYRLGLRAQNNRGYGLLITETLAGSAADRIGLTAGDLLLSIDGQPMQSEADFITIIDCSRGAHAIEWYAVREGRVRRVEIALDPFAREAPPAVQLSHRVGAWLQQDYPILPSYTSTLAGGYAADIAAIDFAASSDAAAATINAWARAHTSESLPDLLQGADIKAETRLVLASVLAFEGAWDVVFDAERTQPAEFHLSPDLAVMVPMMNMNHLLSYAETDTDTAVDLMFRDAYLSLTAILPKSETRDALLISAERLNNLVNGFERRQVELSLPQVDFNFRDSVAASLKSLGVVTMFDMQAADLSGMTSIEELRVDDVLHSCAVRWDEVGAEAVASTAVTIVPRSLPTDVVELRFDRPFVFVIRDTRTGTILFLGRVVDPSS